MHVRLAGVQASDVGRQGHDLNPVERRVGGDVTDQSLDPLERLGFSLLVQRHLAVGGLQVLSHHVRPQELAADAEKRRDVAAAVPRDQQ